MIFDLFNYKVDVSKIFQEELPQTLARFAQVAIIK